MAKRNRYQIWVSFPADWADEPILAGQTIAFWYPTEEAALIAAAGFRYRGAVA